MAQYGKPRCLSWNNCCRNCYLCDIIGRLITIGFIIQAISDSNSFVCKLYLQVFVILLLVHLLVVNRSHLKERKLLMVIYGIVYVTTMRQLHSILLVMGLVFGTSMPQGSVIFAGNLKQIMGFLFSSFISNSILKLKSGYTLRIGSEIDNFLVSFGLTGQSNPQFPQALSGLRENASLRAPIQP